jgi:hypothetical protein
MLSLILRAGTDPERGCIPMGRTLRSVAWGRALAFAAAALLLVPVTPDKWAW